jgi:hypothetical protein
VACDGGEGWSARPVACAVAADGGPSGVAAVTATRDGGAPAPVAGGSLLVEADGEHELEIDAVDGAGNAASAAAKVRIDRTAPSAELACEPAADTGYACRGRASDALSGIAAVAYAVDGAAWQPLAGDATFAVAHGAVRVRVVDAAGNETVTAPLALADRTPAVVMPPAPPVVTPRVRTVSRPVYLQGRHETSGMVGALSASRTPDGAVAVDLRPLAVGPGRYQVQIRISAGGRVEKVTRVRRVRSGGALPRVRATLARGGRATVSLVVRRRTGGGWRAHAAARLVLGR